MPRAVSENSAEQPSGGDHSRLIGILCGSHPVARTRHQRRGGPGRPDGRGGLADYLRYGRARISSRHLFITVRAPFTKLAVNTCVSA